MAVFGAPLPKYSPREYARLLLCVRSSTRPCPRFNAWLMEERLADAPLDAGIGLNSGPCDAGLAGLGAASGVRGRRRRDERRRPPARARQGDARPPFRLRHHLPTARRRSRGAAAPWRCRAEGAQRAGNRLRRRRVIGRPATSTDRLALARMTLGLNREAGGNLTSIVLGAARFPPAAGPRARSGTSTTDSSTRRFR